MPLVWRSRYPFSVTAATGAGTTWLALADAVELPYGQLVATCTFAALCPPWRRFPAVLGTITGVTVSVLVPEEKFLSLGLVGILFAAAYALGTGHRPHAITRKA